MEKYKKFSFTQFLLLGLILLASCVDNNTDEVSETSSTHVNESLATTTVTVEVLMSDISIQNTNYKINTLLDSVPINDKENKIESLCNDLPQTYLVTDSIGRIILMSRTCISKNDRILINEETTALALVTLYPLFINTTKENIAEIENRVKSASTYHEYLRLVKEAVQMKQEILDDENVKLIAALNDVLTEISSGLNIQNNNTVSTRSSNSNLTITINPLLIRTSGNNVTVRNSGLNPTYECSLYRKQEKVDTRLIKSHKSYGFLDMFSSVENVVYGKPQIFTLMNEGEYRFCFDRMTPEAMLDLARRIVGDALSMVGFSHKDIPEWLMDAYLEVVIHRIQSDADYIDHLKSMSGISFEQGIKMKWDILKRFFSMVGKLYKVVKGLPNIIVRGYLGFEAPHYLELTLCSYNGEVMSCADGVFIQDTRQLSAKSFNRHNFLFTFSATAECLSDTKKWGVALFRDLYGSEQVDLKVVDKENVKGIQTFIFEVNISEILMNTDQDPFTPLAKYIVVPYIERGDSIVYYSWNESEEVQLSYSEIVKAITGDCDNVTYHSARIHCSYENLFPDAEFGIKVYKKNETIIQKGEYKSDNEDWTFDIDNLDANSTYEYQAYILYDGTYYWGDIKTFTTPSHIAKFRFQAISHNKYFRTVDKEFTVNLSATGFMTKIGNYTIEWAPDGMEHAWDSGKSKLCINSVYDDRGIDGGVAIMLWYYSNSYNTGWISPATEATYTTSGYPEFSNGKYLVNVCLQQIE